MLRFNALDRHTSELRPGMLDHVDVGGKTGRIERSSVDQALRSKSHRDVMRFQAGIPISTSWRKVRFTQLIPCCFPVERSSEPEANILLLVQSLVDDKAKRLTNYKGVLGTSAVPLIFSEK